MRHNTTRRCVLTLGLLSALGGLARGDGEPVRVRVLSYNIHHGRGADDRVDLERIAEVIRALEPDIVALQEVDRGVERSGRLDEPAELARLTGMTSLFERNIPYQGGDYGNALLTRLPVIAHRNVPLPSFTDNEQRGVLVVDLMAPDGRTNLRVFATHLDYHRPDEERLASARTIHEIVTEAPERPSILLGDLNALPDSRVLEAFESTWTRANADPLPTFPASEPSRQIDYILQRPAERWRVVEVFVPDAPDASDHRPIFATLELLGD